MNGKSKYGKNNNQDQKQLKLNQKDNLNESLKSNVLQQIEIVQEEEFVPHIKQLMQLNNQQVIQLKLQEVMKMTASKILKQGQVFGEMSIITSQKRLATIVAHSKCQLAVIEKKDFEEILKKAEKQKFMGVIEKLTKIPIFNNFEYFTVKMLYLNSHQYQIIKGDAVYYEQSDLDAIYLIKSGSITISKKYQIPLTQQEKEKLLPDQQLLIRQSSNHSFKKPYTIQMYSLGEDQIFGEEDFVLGRNFRSHSAVCESAKAEILIIKKKEFLNRILSDEATRDYLQKKCEEKMQIWQDKFNKFVQTFRDKQNLISDNSKENTKFIQVETLQRHKNKIIQQQFEKKKEQNQKNQINKQQISQQQDEKILKTKNYVKMEENSINQDLKQDKVIGYQQYCKENQDFDYRVDKNLKDIIKTNISINNEKEFKFIQDLQIKLQEKQQQIQEQLQIKGKKIKKITQKQFINPMQLQFSENLVKEYMKKCRNYKNKNNIEQLINNVKEYPTLSFPEDLVEKQNKKMKFDNSVCNTKQSQNKQVNKVNKIMDRLNKSTQNDQHNQSQIFTNINNNLMNSSLQKSQESLMEKSDSQYNYQSIMLNNEYNQENVQLENSQNVELLDKNSNKKHFFQSLQISDRIMENSGQNNSTQESFFLKNNFQKTQQETSSQINPSVYSTNANSISSPNIINNKKSPRFKYKQRNSIELEIKMLNSEF